MQALAFQSQAAQAASEQRFGKKTRALTIYS